MPLSMPESALSPWDEYEQQWLAEYAMHSLHSRGRRHAEDPHPYRSPYQRDRERIVHSTAFRRMTGKTQVLVASINDHHRTRLTHTLEVTQVARTVARRLRLNEDLTEAIALAHDIGHPPFGHAGEQVLDACLRDHGGFNHNLYGLRRVDHLEERYPEHLGLNLTFEVREAFIQHAHQTESLEFPEFHGVGSPLLEAQIVDIVDSIAYTTHDLDDALGLGFITLADLNDLKPWNDAQRVIIKNYPTLTGQALRTAVIRELLASFVTDLLQTTLDQLDGFNIRSVEQVRRSPAPLVTLSESMARGKAELRQFLQERVYRHHRVLRMTANGKRVLRALFEEYVRCPELLPERHLSRWENADRSLYPPQKPELRLRERTPILERVVADYLAGMTDRFALEEYRRLFHPFIDA